jgi:acetylornithine deacetylase/succinyl-diaminopimelate desuccinylase-like protein
MRSRGLGPLARQHPRRIETGSRPHAEGVHGIDERVYLPSMMATAQMLGAYIGDWCRLALP